MYVYIYIHTKQICICLCKCQCKKYVSMYTYANIHMLIYTHLVVLKTKPKCMFNQNMNIYYIYNSFKYRPKQSYISVHTKKYIDSREYIYMRTPGIGSDNSIDI